MLRRIDWSIVTGISKERSCLFPQGQAGTYAAAAAAAAQADLLDPEDL